MLVEDLLSLPVGTRVLGKIEVPATLPGVIATRRDGTHFIRWEDGCSSVPLGTVREYDEYIAAHTQLQPKPLAALRSEPVAHENGAEQAALTYTSRVRRA